MGGSGSLRELTRNRKVEAALHNEAVTRERVQALEHKAQEHRAQLLTLWALVDRGFWGRLRWLFTGR